LGKTVNIVSRTPHFLGYSMKDRRFESWQSQEIFVHFLNMRFTLPRIFILWSCIGSVLTGRFNLSEELTQRSSGMEAVIFSETLIKLTKMNGIITTILHN